MKLWHPLPCGRCRFQQLLRGLARDQNISPVNLEPSCLASAQLPDMDEGDLRFILFSFKASKAPGVDGVRVSDLLRSFKGMKRVLLSILMQLLVLEKFL